MNSAAGDIDAAAQEEPMSKLTIALLAMIAVAALSFDAFAQSRKCKPGYTYDPKTNTCVSTRGSW